MSIWLTRIVFAPRARRWRTSATGSPTRAAPSLDIEGNYRAWDGGPRQKAMGPGAFKRRGALFRLCETIWDVADDIATGGTLGLRVRGRTVNVKFSETPFRLRASRSLGVATSTASRSGFLARRSHGYPVLSADPRREAGVSSAPIRSREAGRPGESPPRSPACQIKFSLNFQRCCECPWRPRPARRAYFGPSRNACHCSRVP